MWAWNTNRALTDLTGDGLVDRVAFVDGARWRLYRNPGPEGLLKRVTNELGGTTELTYVSSTAFVGEEPTSLAIPYEAEALGASVKRSSHPRWVVYEVVTRDGRGGPPQTRTLKYAEFRDEMARREYRGARRVEDQVLETGEEGAISRSIFHQSEQLKGRRKLLERVRVQ